MSEHPMDAARLSKALALINRPERWLKVDAARDCDGRPVEWWDDAAVSFCFVGALYRVEARPHEETAVRRLVPGGMIGLWNDHAKRTHAEVLDLGRRAVDRVLRDMAKADRRVSTAPALSCTGGDRG